MQGVAKYMELSAEGEATAAAASTAVLPLAASHDSEELRWWLEIIAAGEVRTVHGGITCVERSAYFG